MSPRCSAAMTLCRALTRRCQISLIGRPPKTSPAQGKAPSAPSPDANNPPRLTTVAARQTPRHSNVSSTTSIVRARVPAGEPDLQSRAGAGWSGRGRFSVRRPRPASLPSLPCVLFDDRFANGFRSMASASGVKGEELPSANSETSWRRESADAFCGNVDDCRRSVETERDSCKDIPEVAHAEKGTRKVTEDAVLLLCGEGPPSELSDDEEGEVTDADEFTSLEDTHISYKDYHPGDVYPRPMRIAYSRHRDGSIYRGTNDWKQNYCITNRDETRFQAMKLSDPNEDCKFEDGKCIMHSPRHMLQIFSLKLANIPMDGGSVELYGYMAARDILDPLLNYVVKFCRDKPIIVQQGSLIGMTGPKRGIELYDTTLIEYDMRIKTGEHEKDDLELIDGVSMVDDLDMPCNPFTRRIHGSCGAVDITLSRLDEAVEATVEVIISEVCSSFNLSLSCFISGLSEEIRLFDGTVGASCGLKRRSVVAVVMDTWMDLKFKVGSGPASFSGNVEHCCSFRASNHGFTSQQIKVGFASISVKVTWSTLSYSAVYKIF